MSFFRIKQRFDGGGEFVVEKPQQNQRGTQHNERYHAHECGEIPDIRDEQFAQRKREQQETHASGET